MIRNLIIGAVMMLAILATSAYVFQPSLETIHKSIQRDHQEMIHISADEFAELDQAEVVVFDVREEAEFEVSHIEGAIQIPPDVDVEEFIEDFGEMLDGKQAIFYCSVGRRSSDTLARLTPALEEIGVNSTANLEGGIFNWANQDNSLIGDKVHPYNQYWGRLLADQSKVSYRAMTNQPTEKPQ